MTGLWIVAGVACWIAVAVPVGVVIGRSLRIAERSRASHPRRTDKRLVYRCSRCRERVDYASELLVDVAGSVHELRCSAVARS